MIGVVDRDDAGVFELPGEPGFVTEAVNRRFGTSQTGLDLLQRYIAIELGIKRQPDFALPAFSELVPTNETTTRSTR